MDSGAMFRMDMDGALYRDYMDMRAMLGGCWQGLKLAASLAAAHRRRS